MIVYSFSVGWDQEETIQHLIVKAGCDYDPTILEKIQLVRYQTEKRSMSYDDYCKVLREQNRPNLLEYSVYIIKQSNSK